MKKINKLISSYCLYNMLINETNIRTKMKSIHHHAVKPVETFSRNVHIPRHHHHSRHCHRMRTVHYKIGLCRGQIIWIHPQVDTPTTLHIQRSPRALVHMHNQHHPAAIQATTTTPRSMDHGTNNNHTLQNGGRQTPRPTTRWLLAPAWPMSTSTANKVNQDSLWRAGGATHWAPQWA